MADFCDEGPAIVLALLGIALAGGVVVPLNPALPAARLRSLLADADVSLLLCSAASSAALPPALGLRFCSGAVGNTEGRREVVSGACMRSAVEGTTP